MLSTQPLRGYAFWVTRPQDPGKSLSLHLSNLGATCYHRAVMRIETTPCQLPTHDPSKPLLAIFTSQHAIPSAVPALLQHPGKVVGIAMGPATAQAMAAAGLPATHVAPKPYGSRALLTLPLWAKPAITPPVIFTGEGCSVTLLTMLHDRGLASQCVACYRRHPVPGPLEACLPPEAQSHLNATITTSTDHLKRVCTLAKNAPWFASTPMLVIHQGMAELAKAAGCQQVIMAQDATNQAIAQALCGHFHRNGKGPANQVE